MMQIECSVCLQEKEETNFWTIPSCSHSFCKLCISRIAHQKIRAICPLCRNDFTSTRNTIPFPPDCKKESLHIFSIVRSENGREIERIPIKIEILQGASLTLDQTAELLEPWKFILYDNSERIMAYHFGRQGWMIISRLEQLVPDNIELRVRSH